MLSELIRYTEAEAAMIGRLAQVRVRADAGDRRAKAQIAAMARQLAGLVRQAKRGNARAARAAQVLQESGLLVSSQTFAMEGAAEALGPPTSAAPVAPPAAPDALASLWNWKIGNFNVMPLALLVNAGFFAWRKRWVLAALPLGVLVAHEGHEKRWW